MADFWGMAPTIPDPKGQKFADESEDETIRRIQRRFGDIGTRLLSSWGGGDDIVNPTKQAFAAQFLGEAFATAYNVVRINKDDVERVANAVLEEKEIYGDALFKLLSEQHVVKPDIDWTKDESWPKVVDLVEGPRRDDQDDGERQARAGPGRVSDSVCRRAPASGAGTPDLRCRRGSESPPSETQVATDAGTPGPDDRPAEAGRGAYTGRFVAIYGGLGGRARGGRRGIRDPGRSSRPPAPRCPGRPGSRRRARRRSGQRDRRITSPPQYHLNKQGSPARGRRRRAAAGDERHPQGLDLEHRGRKSPRQASSGIQVIPSGQDLDRPALRARHELLDRVRARPP